LQSFVRACGSVRAFFLCFCKNRNRSHTQTQDKNNTTNDHTKYHSPHLNLQGVNRGAVNERG